MEEKGEKGYKVDEMEHNITVTTEHNGHLTCGVYLVCSSVFLVFRIYATAVKKSPITAAPWYHLTSFMSGSLQMKLTDLRRVQ